MTNGCQKGKAGEREAAEFLRSHGFEAKRGQQHAGGYDSPDVRHNIPGVHIEVKRVEKLNIDKAMDQARADAKPGETPIVLHRRNRKDWLVTIPADKFMEMLEPAQPRHTPGSFVSK